MMFPASMNSVSIIVHKKYQENLIYALHESGLAHISNIKESTENLNEILNIGESHNALGKCTEYKMNLDRVLNILNEMHVEKDGALKSIFFPSIINRTQVSRDNYTELFDEIETTLKKVDVVLEINENLSKLEDSINAANIQKDNISLLTQFDFKLSSIGKSDYLYVVAGTVENTEYDEFNNAISQKGIEELIILKEFVENKHIIVIATLIENSKEIDTIVRSNLFNELNIRKIDAIPIDAINILTSEIDEFNSKKLKLVNELESLYKEWNEKLLVLKEELEIEWDRMDCFSNFGNTDHVSVIECWIDSKDVNEFSNLCEQATDGHVVVEFNKPSSNDVSKIPIKYNNPKILQPFEFLTTMFSRPKYDEIDPTFIIAPLIVMFFGLMLGDAIYGILIAVFGFALYRGIGKIEKSAKDMSVVLMSIGFSAIVFGILQGGYFGNAPDIFLGIENVPYALLGIEVPFLDPLEYPIIILILSLAIGLIHLNLGLVISLYQDIQRKNYKEIICGPVAWFIIQPFAFILMLVFFGWAQIDPMIVNISLVGVVFGSTILFIKNGPLAAFDLTGYLGNWLSYARILALALATSGIAMTINFLTRMVSDVHPILIIGGVFIFIVGHLFNFILQSLGAFIHSLRLQYVEFFGQFYVGGGLEFSPFKIIRRYTKK